MSAQRTLDVILGDMFALNGVKESLDALKREFAASSPEDVRSAVGSAFAILSIIINAAGGDVARATGSFFLGLCGNDLAAAVAVLAEQKRRIDAQAEAGPAVGAERGAS